jgi:hypothetical protein
MVRLSIAYTKLMYESSIAEEQSVNKSKALRRAMQKVGGDLKDNTK